MLQLTLKQHRPPTSQVFMLQSPVKQQSSVSGEKKDDKDRYQYQQTEGSHDLGVFCNATVVVIVVEVHSTTIEREQEGILSLLQPMNLKARTDSVPARNTDAKSDCSIRFAEVIT